MKKEMIKAIRLVIGFKPDLRIKLTTANENALYDFIDNHSYAILGYKKAMLKHDDFPRYERAVWAAVHNVVYGVASDD